MGKSSEKSKDAATETGKALASDMRPLPEMAQRLVDLEKRVKALEAKTDRPH